MSDVTCSGCDQVMDQSDMCKHFCPPSSPDLDHWQKARERDIAELREQVRNLQLAVMRHEAAAKAKVKP